MINVQESVLAHKNLRYTTDIGTLSLIFTNKTFRCTCLASGKLNDAKEKERNGIDSYAETKYIVCFSS